MNGIHLRPSGSFPGAANAPSAFRFSTDMFPERERIPALCDFYGRGLLKLDIEPLGDTLHLEATSRALPGLRVVDGRVTGMAFDRPTHLIDSDDVVLGIAMSGQIRFTLRDREAVLQTGDAALMGAGRGASR